MADKLELVSITPTLALEVKVNEIKTRIVQRLIDLKLSDHKYKMSNDVLLLVCNLVEHLVKDKKLNKKNLVLEIMHSVYVLQNGERSQLELAVEFLHSNKAIKKLSRFYLFCVGVMEYFTRSKKGL